MVHTLRIESVKASSVRQLALVALVLSQFAVAAQAQTVASPASSAWSLRAALAGYFVDDDAYAQPTVTADRGALHLESRFNYEARSSLSFFAGWNLGFGSALRFEVTPMIGGLVGDTDAVVPGLELSLSFRRLEFDSEGEYVVDADDAGSRFLYNWSELSVWATEWLRLGMVTQRTRVFDQPRDIQRGILVGVSAGRYEGTVYTFNPGSSDSYVVASFAVSF